MTRNGNALLVVAALVCSGLQLHIVASVARGEQGAGTRGGVLFYAGFDGSKDATYAAGDAKATPREGGGSLGADGLGLRGSALRTGDGRGYVEYSAINNINAKEGTIEFWLNSQDWENGDGFFHRFIDVVGEGAICFQMYPDGVNHFFVRSAAVKEPTHWEDHGPHIPGLGNRAFGSNPIRGKWSWFSMTWKQGRPVMCWTGGVKWIHTNSYAAGPPVPAPEKLLKILIGDFGGRAGRQARTLIDEVYIYDRALTHEEMVWATQNALTREPGMDIPADFMKATTQVVPDPENKQLLVKVDSGDRTGNFAGTARLEPATGTAPAPIAPTDNRFSQAVIRYTDLPQGTYSVITDITTKDGEAVSSVTSKLVVPGPPVWLKEKVGVSDTPPPPWTPVKVKGDHLSVWGREVRLGACGLPAKVQTQGISMLAGPIRFRAVSGGAEMDWKEQKREVVRQTDAEVIWEGTSSSALGELSWRTKAEYDGFLLHDLSLTPVKDAAVELMELRIPIRGEIAQFYSLGARKRGAVPKGAGTLLSADRYWWIGTDDVGFCGATEHGEALIEGANGAYSIEREPSGDVAVIYRFAAKQTALSETWKLRLVLQATPTKPVPADWRTWRDASPFAGSPEDYNAWKGSVNLWIAYPWYSEKTQVYHPYPVMKDANWYRGHVKNLQDNGGGLWRDNQTVAAGTTPGVTKRSGVSKVTPYALFAFMAPGMPECDFYWKQWYNPLGFSSLGNRWEKRASVFPVPSYIDFTVWKHRQLSREYGHDGLYIDFAGLCQAALDVKNGLGYERGGVAHPATFPVVANREIWKRMYTMQRQENPAAIIIGHVSENVCAPLLSFCDVWINGEGNWFGQLKDDYTEAIPLDELRAEWRAQHFGGVPWWLPAWQRAAILEDKDVAERREDGSVGKVTIEKTHHMLGLGLLLDIYVWPICGTNAQAPRQLYAVQDEFGMGDVTFSGYWNNTDVIGGQDEGIKASAYRKPKGGALVVVYNTARETRAAKLTVDWDQLKSDRPLEVFDAYSKAPVAVSGNALTLDVPRLNYRLIWVK